MPFRDIQTHLRDIQESIDLIDEFLGDMELETYRSDLKTKSAVERQIQILTEAAYRLGPEDGPKFLGPDWRSYCDMGNILRHAYHRIDDQIVWNTIKDDLPTLRAAVRKALSSLYPPSLSGSDPTQD